jgi:ABC-type molybdenum transport system ATPase subunit/photorepair protein PhrA
MGSAMPYDTPDLVAVSHAADDVASCAERIIAVTARWWGLFPPQP